MFFNSLEFTVFLPLVFILHWILGRRSKSWQNGVLILSSYYFYACWDWRFLLLLLFSTGLDYFTALRVHESGSNKARKFWFWLSIIVNLGFLGVFKYYDFFAVEMQHLLARIGFETSPLLLQLILPVGISFYTFHGLSYVIDVYYKRIVPEKNFVDYSLFVCYFPLLVAGPIERATHLLPQVKVKRTFKPEMAIAGVQQIIWGLFKKIVIADNCSFFVNQIFDGIETKTGIELWLGSIMFAFQIYGDFSGYSDIALGVSKLFGIELLQNFKYPYFSRDIAEFWRRWHISLSSWFKDYLYIPLGGSKGGTWMRVRNTFIIFLVSGFWHGANWTFIVWGATHALFFMPLLFLNQNRTNMNDSEIKWKHLHKIILTFLMVCMAWVFFRAENIEQAGVYIQKMFVEHTLSIRFFYKTSKHALLFLITLIAILFMLGVDFYHSQRKLNQLRVSKWLLCIIVLSILFMGSFKNQLSFIYFQF
jgi:alginate O-acetyltransferase complex protein AlgI